MSKEAMKLARDLAHQIVCGDYDGNAQDVLEKLDEALAKQEPKPFGYTLEETMKCWDLGYAAAVKALAKKEQPYADKAASVSNDRIKIDPVTGNVQIGTAKQEQGEPVATIRITQEGSTRTIDNHFADCVRDWPDGEYKLYTTPQPQQEQSVSVSNPIGEFPKTILAVIKEVANRNPKNGLDRWTDYETGAYMQDDADAALLWIKNKAKQEQSAEHVGEPVAATDIQISYEAHAEDPLDWNDLNLKECWHKGFADGFKAAETFHKIGVSQ